MARQKKGRDEKTKSQKEEFLREFENNRSIMMTAYQTEIPLPNIYFWLKHDPQFRERFEEIEETKVAEAEDCLMAAVRAGNIKAIQLFLTNVRPNKWKPPGARRDGDSEEASKLKVALERAQELMTESD